MDFAKNREAVKIRCSGWLGVCLVGGAFALVSPSQAYAESGDSSLGSALRANEGEWLPAFQGISVRYDSLAEPRPIKVTVARIDTWAEGVRLFVTPGNGPALHEVDARKTTSFLDEFDLEVALNATGFTSISKEGTAIGVIGFSVSDHEVVSPLEGEAPVFVVDEKGRGRIERFPFAEDAFDDAFVAVQGWYGAKGMLVDDGKAIAEVVDVHPRSAVGVSKDQRFIYLATFDGRQPKYSEGASLRDMAVFLRDLSCWDAMNLDGGGSTTLVVKIEGEATILNRPSGSERAVANHIGVQALPLNSAKE
ncbi:MAG: phosphodiester glycosidase family protein [Verrucomicrobiota bacterium JB023]|nr:phosphodiester glycosidase family protein [Verrucomicrobiota bacterium JB023]